MPAENLDLSDYFGMALATRTVTAVPADCLLVKKPLWEEMGGFDEAFEVAFGDVDFCMRLIQAGYHNVHNPLAELVLQPPPPAMPQTAIDASLFVSRWGPFPQGFDRYAGGHIWSFKPVDYR
jgi:hypothetical protein